METPANLRTIVAIYVDDLERESFVECINCGTIWRRVDSEYPGFAGTHWSPASWRSAYEEMASRLPRAHSKTSRWWRRWTRANDGYVSLEPFRAVIRGPDGEIQTWL